MEKLINFLKDKITDKISFEEIVNVFEQMCNIPLEEDMIFETGTFTTCADEPMFQISLVRQFSNEDEDLSENIFTYIRNSKVFAYAKNKKYSKVKIWCDET